MEEQPNGHRTHRHAHRHAQKPAEKSAAVHFGGAAAAHAPAPATAASTGGATTPVATTASRPHISLRPLDIAAWGSIVALAATLLPLVVISFYNHSYADDWHYAVPVHLAFEASGGNVLEGLRAAFVQVGNTWVGWQGTYSAIFLMALEPGVISEDAYCVAALIIMGSLAFGTFYFAKVMLGDYLRAPRPVWVCTSCVVLILQLLLQVSPVEGVFWYNSAIYYTFYHALLLVLLGMVARVMRPVGEHVSRGYLVGTVLVALFLAGGNFVTVLVACEVVGVLLVILWRRGTPTARDVAPVFLALLAGAAVSMAAPGNPIRQETQFPNDNLSAILTIWDSSVAVFQYMYSWTNGLVLVGMVALVPIAIVAVRRSEFEFRMPGLVAVASVALLATSFTPTFYSMGTVGPGRVQNVRLDLYIVLLAVNVFWCVGWAVRHLPRGAAPERREPSAWIVGDEVDGVTQLTPVYEGRQAILNPSPEELGEAFSADRVAREHRAAVAFGIAGLVFALMVAGIAQDKTLGENLMSVSAARSVMSGQAATYDQQVRDRLATIENSESDVIYVPYYTNVPKVLLMGDIKDNMNNYINYRLAEWYGKTSILGYKAI